MNKIFKVIWSKSKQCYIVVSEIAKNKTGKKKIVVASILAALAMQSGMITDVMAADPASTRLADAAIAVGTNGVAIGSSAKSQSLLRLVILVMLRHLVLVRKTLLQQLVPVRMLMEQVPLH